MTRSRHQGHPRSDEAHTTTLQPDELPVDIRPTVVQIASLTRERRYLWLFWEEPFIEGRDPDELRREGELSRDETEKRLRAKAPIIRLLRDQIEQHGA